MLEVMLNPGTPGARQIWLRELCGRDEGLIQGTSSAAVTSLLERLVVAAPGAAVPAVADLTVCDRDRLLAAIHRAVYGDRVETPIPCRACSTPFEVTFSLAALEADLASHASTDMTDPEGTYRLTDGRRFRLPTLADERALIGLPPDAAARVLASRCLLDGAPDDPDVVLAAVERAGPLLDLELSTTCPECHEEQLVHFDIQSFLMTALLHDLPGLAREIHRIAVAYGWTLTEILGLPRSQRRAYVALIDADRTTPRAHP